LLLYWAINSESGAGFKDYFWHGPFDLDDTEVYDASTMLLFLHGGLHLYLDGDGDVQKRKSSAGQPLLESLKDRLENEQAPLFVAEGDAREKRRSIDSSAYLSFAYQHLRMNRNRVVVFGHALGSSDNHLVTALNASKPCKLAVAVRQGTPDEVIQAKASTRHKFPSLDIAYFDASTHPLGSAALTLPRKSG